MARLIDRKINKSMEIDRIMYVVRDRKMDRWLQINRQVDQRDRLTAKFREGGRD